MSEPEPASPEPAEPEEAPPTVEIPALEIPGLGTRSPEISTVEAAAEPAQGPDGPDSPHRPGRVRRGWRAFGLWRHRRPFWGAVFVLLGSGEILYTYNAPFGIVVHFGLYGLAGYFVPAMLALVGFLIMFDPAHRTFYSLLAVLAALGTWLTSNLGGFVIGMLFGLLGGSLAFGWQYGERPARGTRKRRLRLRTRARAAE